MSSELIFIILFFYNPSLACPISSIPFLCDSHPVKLTPPEAEPVPHLCILPQSMSVAILRHRAMWLVYLPCSAQISGFHFVLPKKPVSYFVVCFHMPISLPSHFSAIRWEPPHLPCLKLEPYLHLYLCLKAPSYFSRGSKGLSTPQKLSPALGSGSIAAPL